MESKEVNVKNLGHGQTFYDVDGHILETEEEAREMLKEKYAGIKVKVLHLRKNDFGQPVVIDCFYARAPKGEKKSRRHKQ